MSDVYPLEPWLRWSDISLAGAPRWETVDALASQWLGRPCLALPSVRVGMCWVMEYKGYARHRDNVLVPRFVGRCILNAIGRYAFPVERPSPETRLAIVVDQFGLRQRIGSLAPEFARRGWDYLEDSPYGVGHDEGPGPGSLGRLIGLGKVLPVALGALCVTEDLGMARFIAGKRSERSAWAGLVWMTIAALRLRQRAGGFSTLAELAYELYPAARGGHRWLRGNLGCVLRQAAVFEDETRARLALVSEALGDYALMPDLKRLGYVVPCFVGAQLAAAQEVFRRNLFDDSAVHVDVARNMLDARYVKGLLLPINPRVARPAFDALVAGLRAAIE